MQIKNIRYNQHGTIDCEIDHPEFGWIPFTASPDDCEQHGRDIYAAALSNVTNLEVAGATPCS